MVALNSFVALSAALLLGTTAAAPTIDARATTSGQFCSPLAPNCPSGQTCAPNFPPGWAGLPTGVCITIPKLPAARRRDLPAPAAVEARAPAPVASGTQQPCSPYNGKDACPNGGFCAVNIPPGFAGIPIGVCVNLPALPVAARGEEEKLEARYQKCSVSKNDCPTGGDCAYDYGANIADHGICVYI